VILHQSNIWRPPTDVFELEDRLVVLVEIGGMRDGEFNVVLQDRRLMISGVRRRVIRERVAYHQMEVRYGEFRTEVSLPWPVNRESVSATYKEGFLRVELPHARNQQIHIVDVDLEQEADG
jgi:HSP20 family protein